jgi:hypothetical protein
MKLAIHGQAEQILQTRQILLVGMQAKVSIKVFQQLMRALYTLLITRAMEVSKRKLIERNNG